MEKVNWRVLASVFLIVLGVVILASNLNLLPWDIDAMQWIWMVLFGGGGLAFLAVFLNNRENWWAVIPGMTLIGLAGLLTGLLPDVLGGAFFLAMIGLSFWIILLTHRENWWAVIPGGTLITLALVAFVGNTENAYASGAAFFFGLALTFLLVYLLPTPEGRMRWALWPMGALAAIGTLLTLGMEGAVRLVAPVTLILAGAWVTLRAWQRQRNG